jgi:hypothetical protein
MAILFCLFRLADVVTALVVIRIIVQFLAQTIGIIVLRSRRPDVPRPFRMWLYPWPAVLAIAALFAADARSQGYATAIHPRRIFQRLVRSDEAARDCPHVLARPVASLDEQNHQTALATAATTAGAGAHAGSVLDGPDNCGRGPVGRIPEECDPLRARHSLLE